jgi:YbbR domain-containing protein
MENKRYHIVLASIVFAMLTWLSVNMRYDYTVVRRLPVVLENMKEGKALKYPVPKYITARFKGNGWIIAGLYLTPEVKYYIDVSSLTTQNFLIEGRDLFEHVKIPFAVELVDSKPDSLVLALDEYMEKRVPIIPRLAFDYHEGYGPVGSVRIAPESILVGGSKDRVEQVTAWHTVYEKFSDLRSSIDAAVDLEPPATYSLTIPQQSVHLQLNVQPFAEKVFSGIPVTAPAMPANREVVFMPPKIDIIVRGGIDQLAKLTNNDFDALVNAEILMQDSVETVEPVLVAPNDVRIVNKKPANVKFIIRKRL